MSTPHIESKKEDIAKKVIMPGDPKRAEFIAKTFLTDSKEVNTIRGETAYTGYYKGERITIFSSGMGIPSMGIYSHELFDQYEVEYIIRVGTAGSYSNKINIKDIYLADSSYSETCFDTESVNENQNVVSPSLLLNTKIIETAKELNIDIKKGTVHTTEAFYGFKKIDEIAVNKYNALVVEMESYALFLMAKKFHKHAASILTITDSLVTNERMTSDERTTRVNTMISVALETLLKL